MTRNVETRGAPGLLLDRDGVIIEDVGYLHRLEDIREIPGSLETVAYIAKLGVPVAVVTNQSGVARGYYEEADVYRVHRELSRRLQLLDATAAFYSCPEHPDAAIGKYKVDTGRRKPDVGMLVDASSDMGIELGSSVMVGDRCTDIEAGRRAGCLTVLVRTGLGTQTEREHERTWDVAFESLYAARDYLFQYFSAARSGCRGTRK